MKWLLAAPLLGAFALACSSPAQKTCSPYTPPANLDTKSVSFASDVVPIFVQSCAFSTCHGAQSGNNQGVYLGTKSGTPDTGRIYTATVGVASLELPSMPFVTKGDPANSYLMHKIDGDACTFAKQCVGGDCGSTMPEQSDLLPEESRLVIRRWITQGALEN
jgi:hypothetical protein